MTTLVSWITYSSTGERPELPRAIYMASDSRITWGSEASRWDAGRKIFSSREEPHVFGYCGDVVFPSLVLGQIVAALDNRVLLALDQSPDRMHAQIFDTIKSSYNEGRGHPAADFSILHAYRSASWPETKFHFWRISYSSKSKTWLDEPVALPTNTGMIVSLGSGADSAESNAQRWSNSDVGGTSRSFFSSFWEAIESGADKLSGGPAQLCALYPQQQARTIGVVSEGRYFLCGLELGSKSVLSGIEWKDKLFHDIDPETNSPKQGARRFARPSFRKS